MIRKEYSAGGVVVQNGAVLLIRPNSYRWQLPKGHIEEGETAAEAAVREVREETGVSAAVVRELSSVKYEFYERRVRIHKTVRYFLMSYVSGNTLGFDREEVDSVSWVVFERALSLLSFANDRKVVREGLNYKPILDNS